MLSGTNFLCERLVSGVLDVSVFSVFKKSVVETVGDSLRTRTISNHHADSTLTYVRYRRF